MPEKFNLLSRIEAASSSVLYSRKPGYSTKLVELTVDELHQALKQLDDQQITGATILIQLSDKEFAALVTKN